MRDASAAGADLDDVDDRQLQRIAVLLTTDRVAFGDLNVPVLHDTDLGRRPAHVEGHDIGIAGLRGDARSGDGTADRPRLHHSHGLLAREVERHRPAARLHDHRRSGEPAVPQERVDAVEVAAHAWADVGVEDGGGRALELAVLTHDVRGDRDEQRPLGLRRD